MKTNFSDPFNCNRQRSFGLPHKQDLNLSKSPTPCVISGFNIGLEVKKKKIDLRVDIIIKEHVKNRYDFRRNGRIW